MAKQISRILCILVLATALTPVAHAQFNSNGFYVEIGAGKTTFKGVSAADLDETAEFFFADNDLPVQSLSSTLKRKDRSISVLTGYRLNKYLGFETGFFRLGAFQYTSTGTVLDDEDNILPAGFDFSFRVKGFLIGATGTLPLGEVFELRGRGGFASTDGRIRFRAAVNGEELADHYSESSQDFYYGVGVGMKIRTFYRVGLDLVHHPNAGKQSADVDNIQLSFSYVY